MKSNVAAAVILIMGVSGGAYASQSQLAEDIFSHQKAIDSDGLVQDPGARSLTAGCTITDALIAALRGDREKFGSALESAAANLSKSADGLRALASKKLYEKPMNVSGLKLSTAAQASSSATANLTPDRMMTGDALLLTIANLADQSSSIIARMRDGKPNNDDLTILIQNNGDISQLILAFYGLLTQRAKG